MADKTTVEQAPQEKGWSSWSLRQEILISTHQWPLILLFCLLGALMGFGVSLRWPTPHRASVELYVGLNINAAQEDENASRVAGVDFNYVDDYKNWQMANLNAVVFMDEVLRETLAHLRQQDAYWMNVTRDELGAMLHVYWRNAGKWRLVAESEVPRRAIQAVAAWRDVVLSKVQNAVYQSQATMSLDRQIRAVADAQAATRARLAEMDVLRGELQRFKHTAASLPGDQPISEAERQNLATALQPAKLGDPWQPLLDAFPPAGAVPAAYMPWLDRALAALDQDTQVLWAQVEALEKQRAELTTQYATASVRSFGFSPELVIEPIATGAPDTSTVRPTALLALIGGAMGFLMWVLYWLGRITMRARQ